jgi:hypothetical protein
MKPRKLSSLGILISGLAALLTAMPVGAQSDSHARIVRLSFVEGDVSVRRPDVQAWAEAPVNTPLQEGFKLSTGESSFAEIQFENGGAIRLGQLALLDLKRLGLAPDGAKIDHVELRQGYATFHPLPSSGEQSLQVSTPFAILSAPGGARFRVDLDEGVERVEVFSGTVEVQSNLGSRTLDEDSVLVMQPGTTEPVAISQGITPDDWDQWVDDREAQAEMASGGPSPDSYTGDDAEAIYGWGDLSQYGTWDSVPGAGFGWSPSTVASGWAPYSWGRWCWYPGWGYTWIGAEPWGWLPYHYGRWEFIPGRGWVWFPGNFRTWSPGRVIWYQGPDWVGWIPLPHRNDGAVTCSSHCGGGVVSASTFRHGGLLTSRLMLEINPTAGEKVKEPGITPSLALKLPGRLVSLPSAQGQGALGNSAHAAAGAALPAGPTSSPGLRHAGAANPNSPIVYDPQEDSYVNGRRATNPQGPPAPSPGANVPAKPANSGLILPAPVGSGEANGRQAEGQGLRQPNPEVGAGPARPAPVPPRGGESSSARSNPGSPAARPAPSTPNNNSSGSGRPAGGAPPAAHPSPAPAVGGGHH